MPSQNEGPPAGVRRVSFVVYGQVRRKGNRRIIARRGVSGRPFLPKSKEAQAYEQTFAWQTATVQPRGLGSKERLLLVTGDVYYRHRFQGDLSIELVLDCMQKAGIITDDRYVVHHGIWRRVDHERPRLELTVTEILASEYPWNTTTRLPPSEKEET